MRRDRILVLQHSDIAGPGWLANALVDAGIDFEVINLGAGMQIPGATNWNGVAVLGGRMGAYEENEYPFLADEKRFLAALVEEEVPVLGICLGAQLLADACGGRTYKAPDTEAGLHALTLTGAGETDPVLETITDRVVVSHAVTPSTFLPTRCCWPVRTATSMLFESARPWRCSFTRRPEPTCSNRGSAPRVPTGTS
jgi:GMP synthase-like glutamine amidotransferase